MKMSEAFPSKFLKASDLQDQEHLLTIDRVEMDSVGRDKEEKPILYFRKKQKGLVLNVTNTKTISKLYGDDSEEWAGKEIVAYPTETDYEGERVECIRVKAPKAAKAADKHKPGPPVSTEPGEDLDGVPF